MYRVVQEEEFRKVFVSKLDKMMNYWLGYGGERFDFVTGPGRSGAIASVYASHHLGVPFVPYKNKPDGTFLVVDTAVLTGATIRKASRYYNNAPVCYAYTQGRDHDRVKFWYEELSLVRGKGNEYVFN